MVSQNCTFILVHPEGARHALGGSDCLSFSALVASSMTSVYMYFEQRSLNFVWLTVDVRPVFESLRLFLETLMRAAAGY